MSTEAVGGTTKMVLRYLNYLNRIWDALSVMERAFCIKCHLEAGTAMRFDNLLVRVALALPALPAVDSVEF